MSVPLCASLRLNRDAPDPYRDLADRALKLGLNGLMTGFRPETSEEELRHARQVFADSGLRIAELGCYVNLIDPNESKRSANIERVKATLRQAEIVGARCVATVSGSLADDMNSPHPDNWSARSWQRLHDALSQILPVAEASGVFMCMEPFILTNLDSPKALRRVIDENPSPALGVLLDPVNLVTRERYFHTGALIDEAFDLLGDRIRCGHAKDTLWVPLAFTIYLKEVLPGEGVLDYASFLHQLNRLDNGTPLCIEHLSSDDEYARAADYLRTIATREGIQLGNPNEH